MPLKTLCKLAYDHADAPLNLIQYKNRQVFCMFIVRDWSYQSIKQPCHNKINRICESKRSLMLLVTRTDITRYQNRLSTIISEIKNSIQSLENDKYSLNNVQFSVVA